MQIDWILVATIATPIVTLFLGVWAEKFFQNKPKVISHLGFISSHRLAPQGQNAQPTIVNTHSVVIKNNGRKSATNIRLGHTTLPSFDVHPDIQYSTNQLPGGGAEIVFPLLVPKKEVTVNYLYFPPLTWNQINTHIESDEGPAKVVTALLQPQVSKNVINFLRILVIAGAVAIIYLTLELIIWFVT